MDILLHQSITMKFQLSKHQYQWMPKVQSFQFKFNASFVEKQELQLCNIKLDLKLGWQPFCYLFSSCQLPLYHFSFKHAKIKSTIVLIVDSASERKNIKCATVIDNKYKKLIICKAK